MDRLSNIFATRKPLIIFTSVGYPTEEQNEQAVCAAIEKGADIIELGVPFSDPMADGPVISAASQVAIKNGMTLPKTIAFAARIRAKYPQIGLILFSYMNPLLHIGYDAVCQQLAEAGVDGILPVDLPLEERDELLVPARAHGLHIIPLVSPLTPEDRVAKIVEGMTGFVYYINVAGVTGARDTLPPEVAERIAMIKRHTALPVAAGFGIASAAAAKAAANAADGVISGSGFVKVTAISPQAAADFTAELLRGMNRTASRS
ncbi:MAG: tryptophan synthase subunit alpha [Lentisphaeria bacterium]|nr:tryptophan synthase subunit alpha [Lentisphaeria bacterium]